MFVTMFVILKDWYHTICCRYIDADVQCCKLCFTHSWRHRSHHQVTKQVTFWNCYVSINILARASIKGSKYRTYWWLSCWHIELPVSFPLEKKFAANSKWRPFWNGRPKLRQNKFFRWSWRHRWCHRVVASKSIIKLQFLCISCNCVTVVI